MQEAAHTSNAMYDRGRRYAHNRNKPRVAHELDGPQIPEQTEQGESEVMPYTVCCNDLA